MSAETINIIVAALICALVLVAAFGLLLMGGGPRFTHGRNPYRRHCPSCGQQQDNHCNAGEWKAGWWEPMGQIMDPDCKCHQAVPEQFRPAAWMNEADRAHAIARRDARRAGVPS